MSLGTYLLVSVAFEMIERKYQTKYMTPESNKNVGVDLIAGIAAFAMFKKKTPQPR